MNKTPTGHLLPAPPANYEIYETYSKSILLYTLYNFVCRPRKWNTAISLVHDCQTQDSHKTVMSDTWRHMVVMSDTNDTQTISFDVTFKYLDDEIALSSNRR